VRGDHSLILFFLLISLPIATQRDLNLLVQEGIQFQKQGRCSRAIDAFKRVLKRQPQRFQLYNRVGFCFEKLKYPKVARKYYLKTLSYDPQNPLARKRVRALLEPEPKASSKSSSQGSLLFAKQPQVQIQDLKRLFVIRDGLLFTLHRNGSNLRQYSTEKLGFLFPVSGSLVGIPLERVSDLGRREIFILEPKSGNLTFLAGSEQDFHSPLLIPSKKKLFFLGGSPNRSKLFSLTLGSDEKPKAHLQALDGVLDLAWHPQTERLFLSARDRPKAHSKIYGWDLKTKPEPFSSGVSDAEGVLLSSDGKFLVFRRRNTKNRWDYVLKSLQDPGQKDLTSFGSISLKAVLGASSSRLYFASSVPGEKDPYRSTLGYLEIETGFVTPLLEHNFAFQSLRVDKTETYLYYLTNYDNQFEAYRLNLETKIPERLTLSDQNETQLGFWD
jgi:hypothetical protein